jgi:hypothetical protein
MKFLIDFTYYLDYKMDNPKLYLKENSKFIDLVNFSYFSKNRNNLFIKK